MWKFKTGTLKDSLQNQQACKILSEIYQSLLYLLLGYNMSTLSTNMYSTAYINMFKVPKWTL